MRDTNDEKKVKIGDTVYYYPTKLESEKCNCAKIIAGDVVKILAKDLLNIKLRCDGNKDFTVRSVGRKTNGLEEGVWDYKDN
jgi:hypothetical protein